MDKIFRWASWAGVILAVLLILVPGTGEAARHNRMNELNYFQTTGLTIDGRQAFRIEIGMERAPAKYTASVSAPDRQITVDLQNMKRGELHQDIRLHSKLADSLHIRQSRDPLCRFRCMLSNLLMQRTFGFTPQSGIAARESRIGLSSICWSLRPIMADRGKSCPAGQW